MALLLRVVNKSENVVVNQVVEEVNPSIEVGFDICGTTLEPDFSDNQGKPQMHLNLPCVLQIYIAFAFKYCIKWLGVSENLIGALPTLFFFISTLLPVLIRKMPSYA